MKWAYLAGVIDGEGWVGAQLGTSTPQPMIQVDNTYEGLIDYLVAQFGGNKTSYETTQRKANPTWKQPYRWSMTSKDELIPLLQRVLPYLVVKKAQVELLIELCEILPGRRQDEKDISYLSRTLNFYLYTF